MNWKEIEEGMRELSVGDQMPDAATFQAEAKAKARNIVLADKVLDEAHLFEGNASKLPFEDNSMDLVFTSGVLIHISPDDLLQACSEIHRVSRKYRTTSS